MYWWDGIPHENLFMEITDRTTIGAPLLAPIAAWGGRTTPGYALLGAVHPGDLVVHYKSDQEAIVSVSRVVGEPTPTRILWAARGTSARRSNRQEEWLPGLSVKLADVTDLMEPVSLRDIRNRQAELLRLRDRIAEAARGPIYFPWAPYGNGPIRTAQSYLTKFPRAAVTLFPAIVAAVSTLESSPGPPPEDFVQATEADVAAISGKSRTPRGQGFQLNQLARVAIEAHAMELATAHFEQLGEVHDVHGSESYDLECDIDGKEWHIEVKGTTTAGDQVILTPLEVAHAKTYPYVALFLVSDIQLHGDGPNAPVCTGGSQRLMQPWTIDDDRKLNPIGYKYNVPTAGWTEPLA